MVIDFLKRTSHPIKELIDKGESLKAYSHKHGWNHQGLTKLAKSYGLKAISTKLSIAQIPDILERGKIPIISIKWAFQPTKSIKERLLFWKKYGGHLAVVSGYRMDHDNLEGFYINHTSIREKYNWQGRFIPLEQFKLGYTGRAIIVE